MKKILFSIAFMAITALGFTQGGCPQINSAVVNEMTPGQFRLTLSYEANGTKHIDIRVYANGSISASNLVIDTCITIQGDGSLTYDFSNSPSIGTIVVLESGTGNCNGGNGNSCSQNPPVNVLPPGGPLPVIFENFFASRNKSVVNLSWKTLSEINSKEFVLQKKTTNGFVDVKTIASANSANGSSYTTTDVNSSRTTTLYRLKMVDFDGSFRTSETRTVKGLDAEGEYIVFPNPAMANSKVTISDISEPTNVQIIDNAGRVVSQVTLNNTNTIDVKNLRSGVYQVRINPKSQNTVITRKLSVVN